jgi:Domain of unknown function (DUF4384)
MTSRRNSMIAALALAAALCALGSGGARAGEYAKPDSSPTTPETSSSASEATAADKTPEAAKDEGSSAAGEAADTAEDKAEAAKPAADDAEPAAGQAAEAPDAETDAKEPKDAADSDDATDATGGDTKDAEDTKGTAEQATEPDADTDAAAAPDNDADKDKDADAPSKPEEAADEPEPETTTADKADTKSSAAAGKANSAEIPAPTDPIALAAFQALEANCARCHQVGRIAKGGKPKKNFGNVLLLEEIAQKPSLILPGNPDGSKLFTQIAKQEMPYDCFQEFSCDREPTEKEVKAVYDWIKSLGEAVIASCGDRNPIDEEAIVTAIAADLDDQQEHLRKGMRYITLTGFYNGCAKDAEMVRYRQGVVKLLNSLSREPDVVKLRTIDPDKTIIAFNLDDLGWSEEDWNRIASIYPYAMKPDATVYDTVASLTGTPLAWVRGDWFAFTASRPPLYYDLLKLPKDFAGLEKQVDVDVKSNIEKFLVKRAGFQNSGVSKHNRLIERHSISTGYFWTSYDFKGDRPEQSLFVHPLGPDGADAFKHDGGETIFSLPNGFQAYYLNTAKGTRLDKGPTEIVLDDSQLDRAVTNGISCMGCHNQGIRQATDDIRKHVLGDRTFSKEVRTQVEALYPPQEEFKELLTQDADRFIDAMKRAGLDPDLDKQEVGVESINFLSKAYENAIDLRIAAAEYGLTAEAFAQGLADAGGASAQLKRRLEQGVLPREILEAEFKELIVKVSDNEPIEIAGGETVDVAKVGGKSKEETHDFDLALISDKSDYKVNDLPVFTITSKEDCHLTLINVDAGGEGTVIFPNKFQQDNLLAAGKETQFPGKEAPFQFRLKDPGTETVIAICNATGKQADGIKHDFKKREFTPLGNYRKFLTRQIVVEGQEKVAAGQKEKAKDEAPAASEVLARTAIKLDVK